MVKKISKGKWPVIHFWVKLNYFHYSIQRCDKIKTCLLCFQTRNIHFWCWFGPNPRPTGTVRGQNLQIRGRSFKYIKDQCFWVAEWIFEIIFSVTHAQIDRQGAETYNIHSNIHTGVRYIKNKVSWLPPPCLPLVKMSCLYPSRCCSTLKNG